SYIDIGFFFSSRRRHTRSDRDWSSDVCSSDLLLGPDLQLVHPLLTTPEERAILKARGVSYSTAPTGEARRPSAVGVIQLGEMLRSEERRVGKECGCRRPG